MLQLGGLIRVKGSEEAFSHAVRYFNIKIRFFNIEIRCFDIKPFAPTTRRARKDRREHAQDMGTEEVFSSFIAQLREPVLNINH